MKSSINTLHQRLKSFMVLQMEMKQAKSSMSLRHFVTCNCRTQTAWKTFNAYKGFESARSRRFRILTG